MIKLAKSGHNDKQKETFKNTPNLTALTGVANARGLSPKPTVCRSPNMCLVLRPQQEVTRRKASLKPTLPEKSGVVHSIGKNVLSSQSNIKISEYRDYSTLN